MSEEKGTIGGGWDSAVSMSEVQTSQGMGGGSDERRLLTRASP